MKIVKSSVTSLRFVLSLIAVGLCTLAGCSPGALKTDDPEPDAAGRVTGLGRTLTKAEDIQTDSYISQINSELGRIKAEGGAAPANIEEAKRAVKFPSEMWIDSATKKELAYDPVSGTVSRAQ